jgi:hypothetical protein
MKASFQKIQYGELARQWFNCMNSRTGCIVQDFDEGTVAMAFIPGENINAAGEFVPATGFGASEWQVRAEEAEAELKAIEEYCSAVLDCNQTMKGSQFTANRVLEILRGES